MTGRVVDVLFPLTLFKHRHKLSFVGLRSVTSLLSPKVTTRKDSSRISNVLDSI